MLLFIGLAIAAFAAVLLLRGTKSSPAVFHKFGLPENKYKLISTDLGGRKSRIFLSAQGVQGIPDAVFMHRQKKEIVVGEFKSRKGRKYVRYNEFYQTTLYMGHLLDRYPDCEVRGIIAYADGATHISYDAAVYNELIKMRSEVKLALLRKKLLDKRPLQARMNVTTQNPRIRFRVN